MKSLGRHLLIEMRGCDSVILHDLKAVKEAMISAAQAAKATIVEVAFHEFSPYGISGMIIIAESHLSIHTWPEYNYAAVDIFTCGDIIDPGLAAKHLVKAFKCKNPSLIEMKRGILPTIDGCLPHKPSDSKDEPAAPT